MAPAVVLAGMQAVAQAVVQAVEQAVMPELNGESAWEIRVAAAAH